MDNLKEIEKSEMPVLQDLKKMLVISVLYTH